jgi:hypothetical protein
VNALRKKIVLATAIGGAIVAWATYCLTDKGPSAYLSKFPLHFGGQTGLLMRPPTMWIGQQNGLQIHTFQGDYAEVVQEAREHFLPANWTEEIGSHGTSFTSPIGEQVAIRVGRSMYLPDPHYRYPGKSMYGRFIAHPDLSMKHFRVRRTKVEGWLSIDHSWKKTPGKLDPLLDKMKTMPDPIASLAHKLTS